MANAVSSSVLRFIRSVVDDPRMRGCADRELLARYLGGRDEAAFVALVRRHGPMVLDVCRGVLACEADAEDAFQATFLVLAKKAGSIREATSLAGWLHGVAYRVARRAQTEFARRQKHEAAAAARPGGAPTEDEPSWREVRQVVHEELGGLPERLRAPLALCYLRGLTQDQAAAELGLPKGTLRGRLERGRALLRARLLRPAWSLAPSSSPWRPGRPRPRPRGPACPHAWPSRPPGPRPRSPRARPLPASHRPGSLYWLREY